MSDLVKVTMSVYDCITGEVTYVDVWDEPPPAAATVVPVSISRFQARAALMVAGLLESVETAISQSDAMTKLAWAEAVEWRRDSPTISSIGSALGLSEEDIDNLFINAAGIIA